MTLTDYNKMFVYFLEENEYSRKKTKIVWKMSICLENTESLPPGEEILGFRAAFFGAKHQRGIPGFSSIGFDLLRSIYTGVSGEIFSALFVLAVGGRIPSFSANISFELPEKTASMPQFAHFVRKLEEFLHISLEVWPGLTFF